MNLRNRARSIRNTVDFSLRRAISFGLRVHQPLPADVQFQGEMEKFFDLFGWDQALKDRPREGAFKVLDVGARNFGLAPVFFQCFVKRGFQPEIHGIEIDAYRRLRNLRTRRDYADYFVSQVPDSQYHVGDFLNWEAPVDCLFAMNPFVTPSPLLAWGLALKHFQPEKFFRKIESLLTPERGLLFVTNPTEEEREITQEFLCEKFLCLDEHSWLNSVGNYPRFGGLYLRK